MARNSSRARALPVTMTRSPNSLAIGTAICPKLPDPPVISSVCPACASNTSIRPCHAVSAVNGMAAATSKAYPSGIFATAASSTVTYSAKAPMRPNGSRV